MKQSHRLILMHEHDNASTKIKEKELLIQQLLISIVMV